MAGEIERSDYYFEDCAPDGWHEYHVRKVGGGVPELFRDGKSLRGLPGQRPAPPQVFVALEWFLRHAGKSLDRLSGFPFESDVSAYLTTLRRLFNDTTEPFRVFTKAAKNRVSFALDVRSTPPKYRSGYLVDLRQHWKPSAAGSGSIFRGRTNWYFTGRHAALQAILEWLQGPSSGGSFVVVTGDPGTGKSALLGLLVTASDIGEAGDESLGDFLETIPAPARPLPGLCDFAMHLKGRTLRDVQIALADCFHSQPDDAFDFLAKRDKKTVLIFDALEEAIEPSAIAAELLSIVRQQNVWLLIGSQRSALGFARHYAERVRIIDLNLPEFSRDTEVASYVKKLLMTPDHISAGNPYAEYESVAAQTADAVSAAAQGNFLVSHVLAQYLVNRKSILDLTHEGLPSVTEEAFRKYLQSVGARLGWAEPERLPLTIRPLAYAEGTGMPRAVWKHFCGTIAETPMPSCDKDASSSANIETAIRPFTGSIMTPSRRQCAIRLLKRMTKLISRMLW